MYSNAEGVPPALLQNIRHNRVLHERVVILVVKTEEIPHVPPEGRTRLEPPAEGFYRIILRYGFMDDPDVPAALGALDEPGFRLRLSEVTYFLGRETLIASERAGGMALRREKLFTFMSRNARRATIYFSIPPEQVIEVGAQVEL